MTHSDRETITFLSPHRAQQPDRQYFAKILKVPGWRDDLASLRRCVGSARRITRSGCRCATKAIPRFDRILLRKLCGGVPFGVRASLPGFGDATGPEENTRSSREFWDRFADNTQATTTLLSETRGAAPWRREPHIWE